MGEFLKVETTNTYLVARPKMALRVPSGTLFPRAVEGAMRLRKRGGIS
jgi:hypothetical protein